MTLPVSFTFIHDEPDLYRLRNWGDPVLVQQAGLSALFEVNGKPVGSNFNPIPLWLDNGTWSAVANALIIPSEDIIRLSNLQPDDDYTVDQKMRWLIYEGHATRPYWTKGEGKWYETPRAWYGTIAFGNNLIKVDDQRSFLTKLPNEDRERVVSMYRLVCFRKSDWGRTDPYLIHRATEVDDRDRLNEFPRGTIYSPLWSPLDWDFSGTFKPQGFWVPVDWVLPA